MTHVQAFLKDEQGITTVEIILILVVLISLVIQMNISKTITHHLQKWESSRLR